MSRFQKKFIYGLFYLIIFILIVFGLYRGLINPVTTCFDGLQNQDEEGIDCGGPCTACEILALRPLKVVGSPKILSLDSGQSVVIAKIFNPNTGYSATTFNYKMDLFKTSGRRLDTIKGESFIYASETKYLLELNLDRYDQDISHAEIEISDPVWKEAAVFSKPNLTVKNLLTEELSQKIKVSGSVINNGAITVSRVKITTILVNSFNIELFASQITLGSINSLEEKNFIIFFPKDLMLLKDFDPKQTQINLTGR